MSDASVRRSDPRFIVHHPRRLVYAELPKCASTTMHKLFLEVSGIRTDLEPHYAVWREPLAECRRAAGLEAIEVGDDALDAFVRRHRGYRFFTVVRDPYGRCLSGYGQQVRRFAKRFRRLAFARAKLRQMLSTRRREDAENPHRVVTETLQRTISFADFVHGLERHGTSFDKHFDLQSNVIRLGRVPYDTFVQMERLAEGLRAIFPGDGDLVSIPACNVTRSGQAVDRLSNDLRRKIHALYEPDFRRLGYAA
jgi:hypothetical protein